MAMKDIEQRAFLFRVGGLGDLLVALPSITLARRHLPDHRLTLVGRPEYAALLMRAGIVDESMSFDDPMMAAIFAGDRTWAPGRDDEQRQQLGRKENEERSDPGPNRRSKPARGALIDRTSRIELAMGWWNRSVDWLADEWWGRQGIGRTCFITYDRSSGQPMSRFFFDRTLGYLDLPSAAACGFDPSARKGGRDTAGGIAGRSGKRGSIKGEAVGPSQLAAGDLDALFDTCSRLPLPAALIRNALDVLNLRALKAGEKRLVVHPGSGGRAKRWPLPNFLEAVRRAASRGINGVLVTGEAEEDLEHSLRAVALPHGWAWVSRLPAETLAALLASSTHYIGNDSGPTHLAAACGARVLAFFREENLPAWRPFGRSHVLSAPAVDRIPLAAALPAIDDFLTS